jgi:hypothetical protein
MTDAAWDSPTRNTRESRTGSRPGPGFVLMIFAELRQAFAAARRYDELQRTHIASHARNGATRNDIPRRIFTEFYS